MPGCRSPGARCHPVVMHPLGTRRIVAVLLVALASASCAGGGGQLAEQTATSLTPPTGSPTPGVTPTGVEPVPVEELRGPRNAAAATRVLTEVETALRTSESRTPTPGTPTPGTPTPADPTLGRRQQLAYRAVSAHPGWAERVVDGVPASVRDAVQANLDAGTALSGLTGETLPTSFPQWEIHRPLDAATLRAFYDEAEAASGIPWAYLAAIHLVETRMGRIHGLSSAGAQGPMQFIPETWASYGEGDIADDHDAIQAAGRYLASRGGPADMDRALFSYNNDDRYVAAVQAYASVLLADPRTFAGYHAWQVFFATSDGTFLLPEGYTP